MDFKRKNIRLARENYICLGWFFVTFCCSDRHPTFRQHSACRGFIEILRHESARHGFSVHAYCLMPDHAHILVQGLQADSDLLHFVKSLKQKSAFQFKRRTGTQLWQRFFYDHILRPSESPDGVAWYIWLNPVRAGICANPEDYPFSGSLVGAGPNHTPPEAGWIPPWKLCSGDL